MAYIYKNQLKYWSTENGKKHRKDASTAFRKRNRIKRVEETKSWRRKYPLRSILSGIKSKCKRKNIEFSILENDFLPLPKYCPVLGIKLNWNNTKQSNNSPSIDRINPNLGYTKGNSMIISWRANDLKRNATLEELKALVFFLEKLNSNQKDL